MRVLASEAFEELSDKFFDVKAIAVQGLRGLRQLRRPRVVDMPGLKRVRQSGRYRVWRTSHSYHEGVAVRVICWFPPASDVMVVALFAGDKARTGDVFYNSVGPRADVAIERWIKETKGEHHG